MENLLDEIAWFKNVQLKQNNNGNSEAEKYLFLSRYVYVWHTITCYWGGVKPEIAEMDHYDSTLKYSASTPDCFSYMPEIDSLYV